MYKKIAFVFVALAIFGCSSGGAYSSKPKTQVVAKDKMTQVESRPAAPVWFTTEVDDAFFFTVKNAEKSGSKELAETKNLLISEILLANTIQQEFMTLADQKAVIKSIRASSSLKDIKAYTGNQYVKSILSAYSVENSETLPYDTGFISYISIKQIKK
jgi:hypothetical protein